MKPKFQQNIRPPGRLTPLLASIQTRQHKSQDDKAQARIGQPFFEWLDVGVCLPAPKKQPGGIFCFCRMCNAVQQHNSSTHTYITIFVMFNMVPVYPGLVSSYGLRVIHISRACHWHHRQAPGRRQVGYVDSSLRAWRERAASTQTLQLKLAI